MQLIRSFVELQQIIYKRQNGVSLLSLETIKRVETMTFHMTTKSRLPYLCNPSGTVELSAVPRIRCDLHRSQRPVQMTNALNISLKLHKHLEFDSY